MGNGGEAESWWAGALEGLRTEQIERMRPKPSELEGFRAGASGSLGAWELVRVTDCTRWMGPGVLGPTGKRHMSECNALADGELCRNKVSLRAHGANTVVHALHVPSCVHVVWRFAHLAAAC